MYYGSIKPEENILPKDPLYRSVNKEISASIENFQQKLSQDEFKQLEELFDKIDHVHSMHSSAVFANGFRLGALMIIESVVSSQIDKGKFLILLIMIQKNILFEC
ncbi:DUF6809 family protein [Paenibacillus sp. OK003]|uniref:DUF6809 family protein n=1 Tax=Paenibacillus sp. OK003 TaxID=1884380 RepID=UPI0034A1C5FA